MERLLDLPGVAELVRDSPVEHDPFWQRPTALLTEMDIQLLYARSSLAGRRQDAIDIVDRLQAHLIRLAIDGIQPPAAIILHTPPANRFMVDELVAGLARLTLPRRQACLYALEAGITPISASTLTWKGLQPPNKIVCVEILEAASKTRHMRLPYVFWEWVSEQIAAPLLELQWGCEQAFGLTWPELVYRHSTMIRIDRQVDAASFLDLANQIAAGGRRP
jgi:hypothetical protein